MTAFGASSPATGDVVSKKSFVKKAEGVGIAVAVEG
jgi:hypothetical protein